MLEMVIGLVSPFTISELVLKPDILHMYVLKSVGHITLALSIVNFSCAVLGGSVFPVAVARPCSWVSFHFTGGICPGITDTIVSNVVLEFFRSCMKNNELSCVPVMEQTMFISLSL